MSDEKKFHRGRSKEGKKQVTLYLTPDEYLLLKLMAEEELRSAGSQALWIVKSAIAKQYENMSKHKTPRQVAMDNLMDDAGGES